MILDVINETSYPIFIAATDYRKIQKVEFVPLLFNCVCAHNLFSFLEECINLKPQRDIFRAQMKEQVIR